MTRAAFFADASAVLVSLVVLCAVMPAHAGCEAPKRKPLTVIKPKPQQVCTCRPMKQARKAIKRAAVVNRQLTTQPAQPVCPDPAPIREAFSTPGAGGGSGLHLVPWTIPPLVLTEGPQALQMVSQVSSQVLPEPQTWHSGPIWPAAAPFVPAVVPPVVLAGPVPEVPEPGAWALMLAGLAIVIRRKA